MVVRFQDIGEDVLEYSVREEILDTVLVPLLDVIRVMG